jgi:hypothetical protein
MTEPQVGCGDEAVGEAHDCGCMNINNTALPEALKFQASTDGGGRAIQAPLSIANDSPY